MKTEDKEQEVLNEQNKLIIRKYEDGQRKLGITATQPDINKDVRSNIPLREFNQNKVRMRDIFGDFIGDYQTLGEWIETEDKSHFMRTKANLQDLYVLKMNSRYARCPVCCDFHTANDIQFAKEPVCLGVKIKAEIGLAIGEHIITIEPGQVFEVSITTGEYVYKKNIKT